MPDPSPRPLPELAREIAAGAVRLTAATAAWLLLVAEFDEREGWAGYGIRSCAEWLAWQCGLSPGPAREHVRVGRALRRLPLMSAAFAEGRLSYSKVRALTRVAEPATEAYLLEFAHEATASQTERTVRQWRRADRADSESEQARERITWWWDEDGMLVLEARIAPEPGAALVTALDSRAERDARRERAAAKEAQAQAERQARRRAVPGASRPEDAGPPDEDGAVALSRERITARRLAALTALAEETADRGRRPGDPPRREVVVHVDAALLADDTAAGRAWIEGGPALSATQARRMLCEGSVIVMLEQDREVLAVGRKHRLATRAQRRALLRRDGGCARPGCTENRIERLLAHHMRHWLHGGRTDLANLVLLCDSCHGLAHDLDLVMTRRRGRLVVTTPDGHRVWGTADAAFTTGVPAAAAVDATPAAGPGASGDDGTTASFVGVHPIDAVRGRRPDLPTPADAGHADATTAEPARASGDPDGGETAAPAVNLGTTDGCPPQHRCARQPARRRRHTASRPTGTRPRPGGAPATAATRRRPYPVPHRSASVPHGAGGAAERTPAAAGATAISRLLFPAGEPDLPQAMHVNGERMDLRYVVSVLMGHRDAVRRWAAESGPAPLPGPEGSSGAR